MSPSSETGGQSGGVNIPGVVGPVGGDIVGRDKITYGADEERLIEILDKKGLLAIADLAGVQKQTITKLAQRLKPGVLLNFEQAIAELEHAVDIAIQERKKGERRENEDAFVNRVIAQVGRSIGRIEVDVSNRGQTQGTCFLITENGYALTVAHLFEERRDPKVTVSLGWPQATKQPAALILKNKELDIALVKLPAARYIPVNTAALAMGVPKDVTITGCRDDHYLTVYGRALLRRPGHPHLSLSIPPQLPAARTPDFAGMSGSPVFDKDGDVIGLVLHVTPKADFALLSFDSADEFLANAGLFRVFLKSRFLPHGSLA
jgi:trypsin-like peptidase